MKFTALLSKYKVWIISTLGVILASSLFVNYVQHIRIEALKATNINLVTIQESLQNENKRLTSELKINQELWTQHTQDQYDLTNETRAIDRWRYKAMVEYYESEIDRLTQVESDDVVLSTPLGITPKPTQIGYDALWQQYCALYPHTQCEPTDERFP